MENLDARGSAGDVGRAYRLIGKVGYIAKGIAFILIGGLFVTAAVTHQAKKSGNLDQALHSAARLPLRPGAAHPGRGRHRLLRPLLLRPGPPPLPVTDSSTALTLPAGWVGPLAGAGRRPRARRPATRRPLSVDR